MEASLAAANIDRVRAVVRKARKEINKVDNDRANPLPPFHQLKTILMVPLLCQMLKLLVNYQLEDHAYNFDGERQHAYFQSPFQSHHWAVANVLYVDIDYTGCQCFPYLLNVVC